jgi:[protein-PII] uridylyltransferase
MTQRFTELVELARARDESFAEISRDECLEAARSFAQVRRGEMRARHEAGESGENVVRGLSEIADEFLAGVFEFATYSAGKKKSSLLRRISLCAQGGYGRAQLNPYSDLDIVLIHEGRSDRLINAVNEYVVPFLWDTGYEVGYAVRSVKETIALAKTDTKVFTSYLQCRLVFGGTGPFAKLCLAIRNLKPSDTAKSFAELKLRERDSEDSDGGPSLYAVEPNVKTGDGGLRDYQTALWLLKVAQGVSSLDEATGLDLISPEERLELAEALDLIWRIRTELHFQAGRSENRLTFDLQRRVALAFGYIENESEDVRRFMEDYYSAARKLRRFLRMAARICDYGGASNMLASPRPESKEVTVEDGELYAGLSDPHWFEENPARLMSIFWDCSRQGVILSHPTERRVLENLPLVGEAFQSSALVRRFFIALCNRPYQAGSALRQAAQAGVLPRYIPEFAAVQDIIRYEEFHHFPVDEHTLQAIEALADIEDMEGPIGACLRAALEHISDPYILVVSLLFHDLGKAFGHKHVEEGAELAYTIGKRIGFAEEDIERIVFLVRHHMVMNDIAMYRDTDDLEIVQAFATTMKSEDRLRALFVHSYADMKAVGPNVWNDWKGTLLMKLYLRAEKFLMGRADSPLEAYWTLPKVDEVRAQVDPELADRVESHIRDYGERYFLAFPPDHIAMHMACIQEAESEGFAVRFFKNEALDTTEAVVCTRDHSGVFSQMAGCFASQLIDVERAALFTRPDGLALDCFTTVSASRKKPLTKAQRDSTERVLRSVLMEQKTVAEYLEPSRKRIFALLQPAVPVPTRIAFDNTSSKAYTVLDLEAGDRTGLLYDIACAMTENGVDVSSARIFTDARRVRDSFYITSHGSKIEDNQTLARLEESLRDAIHPRPVTKAEGDRQ